MVLRSAARNVSRLLPGGRQLGLYMERTFTCPHCGEEISVILDLSVSRQSYVEDCEVCCRPIEIRYAAEDDALIEFSANTTQ